MAIDALLPARCDLFSHALTRCLHACLGTQEWDRLRKEEEEREVEVAKTITPEEKESAEKLGACFSQTFAPFGCRSNRPLCALAWSVLGACACLDAPACSRVLDTRRDAECFAAFLSLNVRFV